MRVIILLGFWFWILSCGPEVNPDGCMLDSIDEKPFVGFVRLCNGIPGQQQDFPAEAVLMVNDTLLSFKIESKDTNTNFEYFGKVYVECKLAESEFVHILHDTMNGEILGSIGLDKTSIFIKLMTSPCLDNGTFSGVLK